MPPAAPSAGPPACRVLLVDDLTARRSVMRTVVDASGDATVVAEAATADAALRVIEDGSVDAAVVELQMPVPAGLAAIAALRAADLSLVIVACSFHAAASSREQALLAGADVYLAKPVNSRELLRAVRTHRAAGQAPDDGIGPATASATSGV